MQTFCISTDHTKTARALDNRRLFSQLKEGYQLLRAGITGPGWANHPAKKMWENYECSFVIDYLGAIYLECDARGINAYELMDKISNFFDKHYPSNYCSPPPWLTDPVRADRVITTHRYRLYVKDPVHYAQWAGDEPYYERAICCDPRNRPKNSPCTVFWPTHDKDYDAAP